MIKGNKGEWSEFYAFLKLLSDRKVDAAGSNLEPLKDLSFPIIKIVRKDSDGIKNYELMKEGEVRVSGDKLSTLTVDIRDLKKKISELFKAISMSEDTTFSVGFTEEIMERLHAPSLGASGRNKEDLILKIHDRITNTDPEVGFSVKSMAGSPPTLLNASGATSFIFEVSGIQNSKMVEINSIPRLRDRLLAIYKSGGKLKYHGILSSLFERNLRKIDTVFPEILAELLTSYYLGEGARFPELLDNITKGSRKFLEVSLDRQSCEFKIKNLLLDVALGMVPATEWNGTHNAYGGYIIVKEDGDIVCYHAFNADSFKTYLLNNTKLDTPSTTRHNFGKIYKAEGKLCIMLNLQIRFVK